MNLKYTSILTLFIFFGFIGNVNGQTTVDFDTEGNWTAVGESITSYNNHTYSEGELSLELTNALRNGNRDQDGFAGALGTYSIRLRNATSNVVFNIANGGVNTFNFDVRRWDGSPLPDFSVEYSVDNGLNWVALASIDGTLLSDSDWKNYSSSVESGNSNIKIRVSYVGGERIMIDNFTWTSFATTDPLLSTSTSSLNDFNYLLDNGPSSEQSFTVSGSNLTNDITLTAPTNYELSTSTGGMFSATSPITLNQTDGEVSETTIYARLKAGLTSGDYTSENVTISSVGADDLNVSLSGSVTPPLPSYNGSTNYSQNFSEFNSVETIPNGWSVEGSAISYEGDWGSGSSAGLRGNANVLGYQHTSSSGTFTSQLEVVNNTGGILTELFISYLGKVERSSDGRSPEFVVAINGTEYSELSYSTDASVDKAVKSTITGLSIADGDTIRVTWSSTRGEPSGSSKQIGISNVVIGEASEFTREITGTAGWRMLSFPVTGGTVEDISDDTAIQGVTGGDNTSFNSNFLYFDSGTDTMGFVAPTNISTPFGDGKGFITYFYDNTEAGSSELPITLDIAGEEPSSDVSVTLNTEGDFLLAGNPFASNLDLNALTLETGTLNENVTIWDNSASSYVTVDRTAGAIASTWQGFWIEYSTGSTNLTIPTSAKTETAATASYFGKANSDYKRSDIKFELISETTSDKAIRLSLRENAILGWDAADASKFQPLLTAYATLGFVGDDKLKSVYSAPYNLDEDVTIPMQLDVVGVSGEFELSWSGMASLPSGFSVMLNDAEEGTSVNLSEVESYTFMIASESAEKAKPLSVLNVKDRTTMKAKGNTERFSLTLMPSISVSNEPNGSQPEVFKLEQNYPNPFNPTTNISFAVANAGNVEISVYNVMGQKVATVLNENRAVGSYQVTFDASSLSSGIYYYRLQSAGQVLTRQMTLIK